MKKLLQLSLVFLLLAGLISGCNLSKTAVVKDTVKEVITTTADYYWFYHPAYGRGKLKDPHGLLKDTEDDPELPIRIIPSEEKNDLGYYIIKPAGTNSDPTTLSTGETNLPGEIVLRRREFKPILIPQRGN